jgi:hypothetical protein
MARRWLSLDAEGRPMTDKRNDDGEGERRRDEILRWLAARRAKIVRRGRRALLTRLLDAGTATVDDVRAVVELPPGIKPVVFGAVPTALADAGLIRAVGYTKTTRPAAHARPIQIWALHDRAGAIDWLHAHPDESDDPPQQRGLFDNLD